MLVLLLSIASVNVMGPPTYISPTPNQYCIRGNIVNHSYGKVRNNNTRNHQGHDLLAKFGSPLVSITNTKVEAVTIHLNYGKSVLLSEIDGELFFFYAHMSDVIVKRGDILDYNSVIGFVGTSGNASNLPKQDTHVHFEVRNKRFVGLGLSGRQSPFTIYPQYVKTSFKCNFSTL